MGFLNTDSMPRLVEKLADGDNIKITGNSKGNRVGTVVKKIVEKADDVTKAIEQEVINDSYSFKVGTGNVDVSADVEDGFGEVGIKGVTYQNILKGFDDGKWTGNHIEKNGNQCKLTQNSTSEYLRFRTDLIKKNTKYTLIYTVTENTMVDLSLCINGENVSSGENCIDSNMYIPNVLGTHIVTFTSSSLNDKTIKYFRFAIRSTTEDGTYVVLKNPILLEGDHTNNPNLPSYFEGIVGVGDKSKNLFNGELEFGGYTGSAGTPFVDNRRVRSKSKTFLSSGSYVVSCEKSTLISICEYNVDGTFIKEHLADSNKKYFELSGDRLVHIQTVNSNLLNSKIQLEKGSTYTEYQPYGTHKIEILSHGKNLYKPNLQTKSANGLTFSLHGNTLIVNGTCTKIVDFRPINGTESITLELYNYVSKLPVGTTLKLSNNLGLKNFFSLKRNGAQTYPANTLIIQEGDWGISCFVRFEEGQSYNNAELKIQLEINNVATEFEPYIEDKTQILLDEPLMRLPNGVCDEITRDGKLIRRVGKKFIDANISGLSHNGTSSNHNQFVIHKGVVTPNSINHANLLCDKKPCKVDNSGSNSVWVYNKATLVFQMDSTINSVEKMRQWLSQNPTTVYYELETPVITELPAPYLRIFKDGHLTFNTLVAPESTHLVQLNKSAQIERSIREVQSLDSRVGKLESFYDDMMLETSHKLNLLTYDFEYTRERNNE